MNGTVILELDGDTVVSNDPTGDLRGPVNLWFEPHTPEGTIDLGASTIVIQMRRNMDSDWVPVKTLNAAFFTDNPSQIHEIQRLGKYQVRAVVTGEDTDCDLKIVAG